MNHSSSSPRKREGTDRTFAITLIGNYRAFYCYFLDMVEFVRAVQESSRPSTADSTSTSDETSRPTTAGAEEETEDKNKDEDEAMSLD